MAESDEKSGGFKQVVEGIAQRHGELLRVFTDFVCMAACCLATGAREDEYRDIAKRYKQEELEQFGKALGHLIEEMESRPFEDLLGTYYNEIGSRFSRDLRGEFYTPKPVCDLMARVTVDVDSAIAAGKPLSVNDPASGSGGMILSLAECFARAQAVDLLRVTCQDIAKPACDMAYVNLTLWGIPARIIWGDTLRGTVQKSWRNIHWHRVGEGQREGITQFMELLRAAQPDPTAPAKPQGEAGSPPPPTMPDATSPGPNPSVRPSPSGQQEWVFE